MKTLVKSRNCEGCTKCCEGFLTANIRGHSVGTFTGDIHNPKPCPFVNKGVGCREYKKRPIEPCRTFECEWIINPDIPEEFKPSISNTIPIRRATKKGIPFLLLIDAGKTMESELLSWYILYCMSKQINFEWVVNGKPHRIGSREFIMEQQEFERETHLNCKDPNCQAHK